MKSEYKEELDFALHIAKGVGKIQLEEFGKDSKFRYKSDNTIQTKADRISSAYLLGQIQKHTPNYGVLSEEVPDDMSRFEKEFWWLIDPLDGSVSHMLRRSNWGPKIALMHKGTPILSVVYRPLFKKPHSSTGEPELIFATSHARTKRRFSGEDTELYVSGHRKILRTGVSRRESETLESMLKLLGYKQKKKKKKRLRYRIDGTPIRESGMKFVEIAKDRFDLVLYAPDMPQYLWDIGASELNLIKAGGVLTDARGKPINYLRYSTKIDEGIIASNGQFDHELFVMAGIL